MYKQSEMWMKKVGYPGKSGIGGMIMIIIPGKMGIGITSPPVNKYMNSYKGLLTAIEISKCLKKK
jgi:glutaminase